MNAGPTSAILGLVTAVAAIAGWDGQVREAITRPGVLAMNRRWIAALPLLLALGGCGYSLTTRLPSHIKTVGVPTFKNETLEYGLEEEITQAVIDKFTEDNNLRVVGEDRADAVVYGVIKAYKRRVAGFTSEEIANEYEVAIIIDVVVRDRVKTKELWAEEGMARTTNYFVDQVESERQGRQPAVQQIAEDIVSRTVQGW
jgi:predicted DNA binding protein